MTDEKRQTQHNADLPFTIRKLEPLPPLYKPHVAMTMLMRGSPALSARAPIKGTVRHEKGHGANRAQYQPLPSDAYPQKKIENIRMSVKIIAGVDNVRTAGCVTLRHRSYNGGVSEKQNWRPRSYHLQAGIRGS